MDKKMPKTSKGMISRRGFMKLSAATAAAVSANPSRDLHALVKSDPGTAGDPARSIFSACDMCFNKCGLIARVQDGVG